MSVKQLISLREKENDLQSIWYRQILALASGGLILLAGINPAVSSTGISKYFLAFTWLFLGIGIIFGAVATYLEVNSAKNLANKFQKELIKNLDNGTDLKSNIPIVATPNKFFILSKPIMLLSLLMAVCCLVAYSILETLNV